MTVTPTGYDSEKVSPLPASHHLSPIAPLDAVSGIVGFVRNGWGDYGYSVQFIAAIGGGRLVARVHHSDGSRFDVAADYYGNAEYLGIVGEEE